MSEIVFFSLHCTVHFNFCYLDHGQDPEAGAAQGADHVHDQDRGESPGVSLAAEVQGRVDQEVEAHPQRKAEAEV